MFICKTEIGRKIECSTCNEGYYLSVNNSTLCPKCSIENCRKCSNLNKKEICQECLHTFSSIRDEYGFIKACECDFCSIDNGICIKKGNWIRILFEVNNSFNNGYGEPMNNFESFVNEKEIEIYYNGTYYKPTTLTSIIQCQFNKTGIYEVDANIEKTVTTFDSSFEGRYFIISFSFLPGFDSSQVTNMEKMFANSRVSSVDMKYLNLSKLNNIKMFFIDIIG